MVMERDNNNHKAEVAAFKELRSSINEQLQEKQNEIDGLLIKIDGLNSELANLSSEYESKISEIQNTSASEIENLKITYESQINELIF